MTGAGASGRAVGPGRLQSVLVGGVVAASLAVIVATSGIEAVAVVLAVAVGLSLVAGLVMSVLSFRFWWPFEQALVAALAVTAVVAVPVLVVATVVKR